MRCRPSSTSPGSASKRSPAKAAPTSPLPARDHPVGPRQWDGAEIEAWAQARWWGRYTWRTRAPLPAASRRALPAGTGQDRSRSAALPWPAWRAEGSLRTNQQPSSAGRQLRHRFGDQVLDVDGDRHSRSEVAFIQDCHHPGPGFPSRRLEDDALSHAEHRRTSAPHEYVSLARSRSHACRRIRRAARLMGRTLAPWATDRMAASQARSHGHSGPPPAACPPAPTRAS